MRHKVTIGWFFLSLSIFLIIFQGLAFIILVLGYEGRFYGLFDSIFEDLMGTNLLINLTIFIGLIGSSVIGRKIHNPKITISSIIFFIGWSIWVWWIILPLWGRLLGYYSLVR